MIWNTSTKMHMHLFSDKVLCGNLWNHYGVVCDFDVCGFTGNGTGDYRQCVLTGDCVCSPGTVLLFPAESGFVGKRGTTKH